VAIRATAVPLNPENASQRSIGRFVYAGGLELKAEGGVRFGGLSDLVVERDGRVLSVSDEGQVLDARLVLDAQGRLSGVADGRLTPLTGPDGAPLRDKTDADSEGIALLPNGDRLVSFERNHRIWRYPAAGGPPVPAPAPAAAASLPFNTGMEAITPYLPGGTNRYLVGSETNIVWSCGLQDGCRETPLGARVPQGFGLSALTMSPDGQTLALVARAFSPAAGVRVMVRLMGRAAVDRTDAPVLDELALVAPFTRDNIEGAALVAAPAGGLRLYLLSDDNFSAAQHTYLMAFDWMTN
jgi:hypothetical protein